MGSMIVWPHCRHRWWGGPLEDPGRFMLAGDWHGDAGWARHVIYRVPLGRDGRRVLIQLGDFGVWPGRSGSRYLDEVAAALAATGTVCLFIDGNHEDFPQLASFPVGADGLRELRPRLYHLPRGVRWTWQGVRFLALGGATSLDRPWRTENIDWWPAEELARTEADRAISGGPCDVMLTHDAPAGVEVPGLPPESTWVPEEVERAERHRNLLREVVDAVRPATLFHGHFHSRYEGELDLASGGRLHITGLANEWTRTDGYVVVDLETDVRRNLRGT